MMNYFLKDKNIYTKVERDDLSYALYDFNVHPYDVVTRLDKYNEYNEGKRLVK